MLESDKHPLEANKSWEGYCKRLNGRLQQLNEDENLESTQDSSEDSMWYIGRFLRHQRSDKKQNKKDLKAHKKAEMEKRKRIENNERKKAQRHKELDDLLLNSGIDINTTHGMMIDAGSSGSRIHVYEFANR